MRVVVLGMLASCGRVDFVVTDADAPSAIVARFEAESGQIAAPFQQASDPRANGGTYLVDGNGMGLTGPGSATFAFSVPTAGTYYVWGRTLATSQATDSFFVQIDGGADQNYQSTDCSYADQWIWTSLAVVRNCPQPATPLPLALTAGSHTLRVHSREGGSAVDTFLVVDDSTFVPQP